MAVERPTPRQISRSESLTRERTTLSGRLRQAILSVTLVTTPRKVGGSACVIGRFRAGADRIAAEAGGGMILGGAYRLTSAIRAADRDAVRRLSSVERHGCFGQGGPSSSKKTTSPLPLV